MLNQKKRIDRYLYQFYLNKIIFLEAKKKFSDLLLNHFSRYKITTPLFFWLRMFVSFKQ